VLVVCHGDLIDPVEVHRAVSFDRSLVLKKNDSETTRDYWTHVILSDQLTIRTYANSPPWNESTELDMLLFPGRCL